MSDVVVLCWPNDAEDVIRLHDHGVPCLLLLDAAADPPDLGSLLVDERDLTARLSACAATPGPRPCSRRSTGTAGSPSGTAGSS